MSDVLHDSVNKVVAAMKSPINQDCYIHADEETPLHEGKQ